MTELSKAIRLLLDNHYTLRPDGLQILKTLPNPVELVERVIADLGNDQDVGAEVLLRYQRRHRHISPSNQGLHHKKTTSRASLLGSLLNKRTASQPPASILSPSTTFSEKNQTTINTSLDELTGLHNYESKFSLVREPILSDNMVGALDDMLGYFQNRFQKLSSIFKRRKDVNNLIKLKDLKKGMYDISVIVMLTDKIINDEESGRLVTSEDPNTEKSIEAVIRDKTLIEQALHIMNDTVICVKGAVNDKGIFFVNDLLLPDVPVRPLSSKKYAEEPVHAAFLSDIHVGSKGFLSKPMDRFIDFLNGEFGDIKHQKIGEHTKYIMFSGDVVDGVGIYPGQQNDLAIDSIHDQYNEFASFLDRIPKDVEVVVIPGNHDMVRSAEPQPKISPQYAPDLASFDNVHLLPNPSQISMHGIETLLYHCTSLPDIMNHIPGLPIEKPVDVMIHMLKARHLAPIWGDKTPIATEPEDHLVIDPLPDIFHGGHVHINGYGGYNGVQIVNSGTMQEQTSYQKSLNIDPTPGLVPIINLQSRKPSLIDFISS